MAKWFIGMIVDGSKLDPVLELLHPHKVKIERLDPVAGTPKRIRAGDRPAWEIVVAAADATPRPLAHFREALVKAGFAANATSSNVSQAVAKRALHKVKLKGVYHYRLPKAAKK